MRPEIPYLRIFGLKYENNIVIFKILSYFWVGTWKWHCRIWNQHCQICLIAKFCEKAKIPNCGTKNVLFEYFWAGIWTQYCHTWNQHPRICQKWVFYSCNKFWYRVRFSQGPGPGSGPFYKLFPFKSIANLS